MTLFRSLFERDIGEDYSTIAWISYLHNDYTSRWQPRPFTFGTMLGNGCSISLSQG